MAHIFSLLHVHCKKQFRYLPMSSFLSRLRRHKLLLAFLPALIFLFCSVFYYEINHSFVAFCDTVFRNEITENTLNLHYTLENPEILNLSDPDVSFGSMNPEVLADSFSQQNIYLEKLFKFPKDWLSTKNRLTYDILTSAFSLQAEGEKYLLYDEPLGPSLGTQAQLPVLLAEYSFHNKKDIAEQCRHRDRARGCRSPSDNIGRARAASTHPRETPRFCGARRAWCRTRPFSRRRART